MPNTKPTLKDRLSYRFDNLMSKGPTVAVYMLLLASIFFIILFSFLFIVLMPENISENKSFIEIFWINLMHLLDPGAVTEDTEWPIRVIMLFVTVFGIIVLSTFIGLVSSGIMSKFEDMRKGRSKILEENHILILGWSSKIHAILSELIKANENQHKPVIAILANRDKISMEDEIREKITDRKNAKIICRSGNPIDLDDLEIANPYNSRSIIILDTKDENSDAQVIKTMLAITSNPKRRNTPYHITAEIKDEKNLEVAKLVGKDEVELILSDDFISRVIVQTSRQSGLSVVYTDFLDFDGDELYFHKEPKLYNKTFRDAIFSYNDSCIIGLHLSDGTILLNPDEKMIIPEDASVIALSEDDDTVILSNNNNYSIEPKNIIEGNVEKAGEENYLILGWNHRTKTIVKELTHYLVKGSTITIIAELDAPNLFIEKMKIEVPSIKIKYSKGNTTDSQVLATLPLESYDHILIQSYLDQYSLQEADAKTLITLLHLRRVKENFGKNLNIVTEMLDVNNRELAKITNVDDFIISYNIIALLMSQVSENKNLMRVFEQLFEAEGNEVYIRPINNYIKTNTAVNFYTLVESALRKKEIAIGYRKMKYAQNADKNYGIILNPVKSEQITFEENDCIIVLAEE